MILDFKLSIYWKIMEIAEKKLKNSKELDNLNILELEKNMLILIFKDNVNY